MRKLMVAVVAVGAVVAGAGPAVAGPPEVSKNSCEAEQGVFARDHGVKTCTTTVLEPVTGDIPYQFTRSVGTALTVTYSGTLRETFTVETTTTQTQKGNGDVATASTSAGQLQSVEWLTCHVEADLAGTRFENDVDPDVCTHPENYSLEDLFTP